MGLYGIVVQRMNVVFSNLKVWLDIPDFSSNRCQEIFLEAGFTS